LKNLHFEWDEAKSVFADDYALLIADPDHSEVEDRLVLLGLSAKLRLLLVCHCFEVDDGLIRIISCRKARGKEITKYRR